LFSNHGHVLLFLANDPQARLRDVAERVGITERAVQKIVRDLQDGGLLSVSKRGRRNRYHINTRKALRHPLESHRTVGNLVSLMREKPRQGARARPEPEPAAPPSRDQGAEPQREPAVAPQPPAPSGEADQETPPSRPKRGKKKAPPPGEQQGSLF